jgi:hypothetical protein
MKVLLVDREGKGLREKPGSSRGDWEWRSGPWTTRSGSKNQLNGLQPTPGFPMRQPFEKGCPHLGKLAITGFSWADGKRSRRSSFIAMHPKAYAAGNTFLSCFVIAVR